MLAIGEAVWMISIYESKKTLEAHILLDAQNTNSMMVNRIDSYISERTVDMINLVHDKYVEQAVIDSNTKFESMNDPRTYIEQQNVTWMSVSQDTITPLMNGIIENPTSDRLREMLSIEKSIFHNDVFGRLLIANSYGADVSGTVKPDDYDQFTDPWWVAAKQNGLYIGDVYFDKASNYIGIPIATRINDDNGNFIGVAKGVVVVDNIFKIIASQMQAANIQPEEYMLLDQQGTVLYSTNPLHKAFTYTFPAEFMKNIQGTSGHFIEYENDENTVDLISYADSASSKISPTSGWIFVTEYDTAPLLQSITDVSYIMIVIMLVIIPVITVIIVYVANRLEKPMKKLSYATNEFKKDNLVKVEPVGTDETIEAINNFNQMTELVIKSRNDISTSGRKYRALFDSSPVAIALVNKDFNFIDVNKQFLQLFDYNVNEIIGKPVTTVIADKSIKEVQNTQSQFTYDVDLRNILFWHKKKNGTEFPALVDVQSVFDEKNEFIAHVAMVRDITDLENARQKIIEEEKSLAKSEDKYRTLFESSPLSILLDDNNFTITSANKHFSDVFGYTPNEIIGKPVSTIIADRSLKDFIRTQDQLKNNSGVTNAKIWHKKKDGSEFPALVNVKSVFDKKNQFITHVAMIEDITDHEIAQETILKHEAKIRMQLEKLTEIDKLKSEFSSMVSHELSTPLFPIKFNAELLKDPKIFGQLNKEQIHSVEEIYENATKLEKLISDVLDSQKLEMSTMKFSEKNIDIPKFMEKILDSNRFLMKENEIEFVNSTTYKGILISDPDRIGQVFSNLIKNSVDFVPEKTGKIEIGAKAQGTDILFYVKDNGIGIPKDKQENLFKKFYQIDTSPRRKHRGSGLGLSICKGIVEGLGGKIWLESAVNVGTIVNFTIPKGDDIK